MIEFPADCTNESHVYIDPEHIRAIEPIIVGTNAVDRSIVHLSDGVKIVVGLPPIGVMQAIEEASKPTSPWKNVQ